MKLYLVSDKQNSTILTEVQKELEKKVLGLRIEICLCAFPADIPFEVKNCLKKAEAIFAYSIIDKEMKSMLARKLIEMEFDSNIKIIKALEAKKAKKKKKQKKSPQNTMQV